MLAVDYPASAEGSEPALCFDQGREWRLLIVPALFAEANRMRRFTVEVMRRLDKAGVDTFLPDLPGCNESLRDLVDQDPGKWRHAMKEAARHFSTTHVLGIRGGGLFVPEGIRGWRHAPVNGAILLRQMLRARIVAAREAGLAETQEGLQELGLREGLDLLGYRLGPRFLAEFPSLVPEPSTSLAEISQEQLGGSGLWLLAEPGEDRAQADTLAALIALGVRA